MMHMRGYVYGLNGISGAVNIEVAHRVAWTEGNSRAWRGEVVAADAQLRRCHIRLLGQEPEK